MTAMAAEGFTGTWQLNRQKSDTFPATQSQVIDIETDGDCVVMREILVNYRGETLMISLDGRFDGLDYPLHGTPLADTVSYLLPAANRIEGIAKKDGVVVVRETAVLSKDRKSVSVTYVSYDSKGQSFMNHGVFDRVDRCRVY
jgi:hypothetical protein